LPTETSTTRVSDSVRMQNSKATKAAALGRAANKLKRELYRLPAVRVVRGYAYHQALEAHALRLPPLDPLDLPPYQAMRTEGTYVTPVDALRLPGTGEMLAACDELADELRATPLDGQNAPRLPIHRLMDFPEIYLWGLDRRLLEFIENYVGLPIRYHGADLRREVADGKLNDVRQWHVDAEDWRMFKIILYLNDVQPGGGPFQYLPRALTIETAGRLHYGSGFVTDDEMAAVLPPSRWVECLAKSHTAIMADTCKVFHRAQPPRTADRYSITFSWTSTTAVKAYPTQPLTEQAVAYILAHTDERQRACVTLPARN
jgi:hypothetical protein